MKEFCPSSLIKSTKHLAGLIIEKNIQRKMPNSSIFTFHPSERIPEEKTEYLNTDLHV